MRRPPMLNFTGIGDFIPNFLVVLFKNRERLFKQFKYSHSSDRATPILSCDDGALPCDYAPPCHYMPGSNTKYILLQVSQDTTP
jgi:hypothetical protein